MDRTRLAALGGLLALAASSGLPDVRSRRYATPLPPYQRRAPEPQLCPPKPQGLREAKRRLRQMERQRAKEKA